ncbi:c6 transcription factor prf [Ceraceosorus bombacis]|uniref:C6 transcription factor prf n=1 Tax=Ceraceosorus bombacis TaxID=401625 RepID=A0A0P1BR79_9BASI|nr:c6 transcription factor prf [Ceraceosorus bombacis]
MTAWWVQSALPPPLSRGPELQDLAQSTLVGSTPSDKAPPIAEQGPSIARHTSTITKSPTFPSAEQVEYPQPTSSSDAAWIYENYQQPRILPPSPDQRPKSLVKSEAQKDRVPVACLHCRSRKVRCDGQQPSCGLCTRIGRPCVYSKVSEEENLKLRARKRALKEKRALERAGKQRADARSKAGPSSHWLSGVAPATPSRNRAYTTSGSSRPAWLSQEPQSPARPESADAATERASLAPLSPQDFSLTSSARPQWSGRAFANAVEGRPVPIGMNNPSVVASTDKASKLAASSSSRIAQQTSAAPAISSMTHWLPPGHPLNVGARSASNTEGMRSGHTGRVDRLPSHEGHYTRPSWPLPSAPVQRSRPDPDLQPALGGGYWAPITAPNDNLDQYKGSGAFQGTAAGSVMNAQDFNRSSRQREEISRADALRHETHRGLQQPSRGGAFMRVPNEREETQVSASNQMYLPWAPPWDPRSSGISSSWPSSSQPSQLHHDLPRPPLHVRSQASHAPPRSLPASVGTQSWDHIASPASAVTAMSGSHASPGNIMSYYMPMETSSGPEGDYAARMRANAIYRRPQVEHDSLRPGRSTQVAGTLHQPYPNMLEHMSPPTMPPSASSSERGQEVRYYWVPVPHPDGPPAT